jgi:hypothetical protein
MKIIFLSKTINVTSYFLRVCIKNKWWDQANKIIEFRKKELACRMRKKLTSNK